MRHFSVLLALAAGVVWGQEAGGVGKVRAMNDRVLALAERGEREISASARQGVWSELEPALAERASALEALMEADPAGALRVAFSPEARATFTRVFPRASSYLEEAGAWTGEMEYIVEDSHDLRDSRLHALLRDGGEEVRVRFGEEPSRIECGQHWVVSGVRLRGLVAAEKAAVVTAAGTTPQATSCSTQGEQKIAVLMVTYPGVTPPAVTGAQVADYLWGTTGRTLDGYWRDASYGKTSARGDVFGWYTLPQAYTCDQSSQIRAAAIAAADADVDFRNYTRIFILIPPTSGCGWAGLGNVGCPTLSSPGDGTFVASTSWMIASYFTGRDNAIKLSNHEGGHNLGLMHARSRDFGAEALGALGTQGTLSEYGDVLSAMGSWNYGHYAGQQKEQMGWQTAGVNTQTVLANTTVAIQPTESATTGVQTLKVLRGTGNNAYLWLEYRQPIGSYDSTLPSTAFGGALVRYRDSVTANYTDLLDFTPETTTFNDGVLSPGRTWTDPYSNVSLSVGTPANGALPVTVTYGPVPCVAAAGTVTVTPANPSLYAGASVNYTVSVRNNDSGGCASKMFSLSSTQPSGWAGVLTPATLTLAPGAAALAVTSATGATPATYPLTATAAGGAAPVTASFSATVIPPPPPLTISVSIPKTTYALRETVAVKAKLLSGSAPVSGVTVSYRVVEADGSITNGSAKTNASGEATWNYRTGPRDPRGAYSVTATATSGGQTATAAAVSFTVQ
jgi:M6 family metalloprotease-like protein